MRILWVSHSSGWYGAERTIIEATPALTALGHHVHVVLPTDIGAEEDWAALGVPVSRLDLRWWMNGGGWDYYPLLSTLRRGPPAVRALRRLIRDEKIDVVLTNSIVIWQGALAARLERVPHIWCIQEFGDRDHGLTFQLGRRPSLSLVDRLSTRVIVHSRAVEKVICRQIDRGKIDLVPYAVDVDRPQSANHDGNLTILGRISEAKGQADAIRAVATLRQRGRDTKLDIVGPVDSDYARSLVALASDLGVTDLVTFAGATRHPQDWYGRALAVLVCSRNEAFGRVTIEAMKAGAPVIGADSAGTAELIDEGVTGLKYKPGDVDGLARAIKALLDDPDLRTRMGKAAQAWASENFTSEKFIDALLSSIDRAASIDRTTGS